jgi:hypothetical protein
MIWKDNKSVAFGIKDSKYVVAWYCPGGNKPTDKKKPYEFKEPSKYVKNVNNICISDDKK